MKNAPGVPCGESEPSSGNARGFVVTVEGRKRHVNSIAGEISLLRSAPAVPAAVALPEARRAA
jgi:hypothetical protein